LLSSVSARVRVLIVALVLSVVAGGGWLIRVTVDESGGSSGAESEAYRGPQPAARQEAVSPKERREQTKDLAKATKPHGLPTTRSKPATAAQIELHEQNQQPKAAGPKSEPKSRGAAARPGGGIRPISYPGSAAAASYSSGALWQVTADPFGNTAAQSGGFLAALGNHIGAAVPGEPLQLSASIYQAGGATSEVHPVKVRWQLEDYCAGTPDQFFDFGQTVQAPTLNTGVELPVVNASITLPATKCTNTLSQYFIYVCTTVTDDPTDVESCGSQNSYYIVPELPEGAACAAVCGDASGSVGTTVMRADPVNTATGAFTEAFTDAQVAAPGVPLTVGRVYSSDNTLTGALGKGWQLPWETRLQFEADGDAVLVGEGGTRHTFTKTSGGTFSTPGESRSKLAADGSGFKVTTADQSTYGFNASGQLTAVKDRTGRGLTLAYTGGRPTEITDAVGRKASLAYVGDRLDTVTLADGRFVDYAYTGDRLTGVTALDGKAETYGYNASGFLDKVTNARGKAVTSNIYDAQGRVASQTDAIGHTTKFAYSKNGEFDQVDVTAPDQGVWTDVYYKNVLFTQLDPLNNKSYYRYDKFFNRTSEVDAEIRETQWDFDTSGRMKRRANGASDEYWTYDAKGNVAKYEDGESNDTVFGYNASNQLISVKDALGKTTTYGYNATTGLLETSTTARGKATTYGYDTSGNLASVTTPKGNKTTYTYDVSGRVKTVVDPRGNVSDADPAKYTTAFTYDDADRTKSVTDARGSTTAYGYDEVGNLTTVTDAARRATTYAYNDANQLYLVTDPVQKQTSLGYDPAGRLKEETNRRGAKVTYQYDKAGNQIQVVSARGNAAGADAAQYTWAIGYDKAGNRKTVTDPLGKTTAFTWDADNRPVSTTDPLNHTRRVVYDDNGNVIETYDGLNHGMKLVYDDNDRLLSSKTWAGYLTTYEYDDDGNLTAEVSPEAERATRGYDDDGNLASTVDPRGNVTGADPAKYTWNYGYDVAGHPTSVTDPLGHQTKTGYDAVGNIASVTDARSKQTVYEYDELGRPKKITAPDTGTTSLTYDAAGFLDTSTDANTNTTTYGHNAEGQLTSVKNPLAKTVAYEYDLDGNRTKVTNARAETITTTVDARNLPRQISYSDGTPTQTYVYDDASRITNVTDATGSRTLTYDNDDKIQSITSPGAAKPFSYVWNTDDTLKSRTYPDNRATSYTYDKVGRIKSQTTNSKAISYVYDKAGNLTTTTLPTTTARGETRTYDEIGRLASLTTPTGTNSYTYDENNRLTQDKSGTGNPTRYAYDDAGRITRSCTDTSATSCLTGTTGDTQTYDKVGNLKTSVTSGTTTTYQYDAGDQLSSTTAGSATTSYTYDADGNQTKDDDGTYAYDPAGRVKSATIGSDSFSFLYDADGNRTVANKNNALIRTSRWDITGDLPQIATDTDASGALIADYHFDPDGTARSMDRTAGTYYFTQDRQNSVSTVFDAAGVDNYRYKYGSWGTSTGTATITGGQSSVYGYTGQYKDQYLPDRLQLRARSYDTTQQRFTTQDPVSATADNPNQSSYNYADNDPANLADPSGNCPTCIGAGIGAVISGGIYAFQHQDDFDWGDFAVATGKGALIGAGAGFLAPAGMGLAGSLGLSGGRALGVAVVTDAAIGMGYTWAINTAQCQPTTPTDLLFGALGGALGPLIGPAWRWGKGLFGKGAATPTRFGPGAARSGDPALLPKGEKANPFALRADAEAAAFDLAGVPYGTLPDAAWIVTGNVKLSYMPGYLYSSNQTHWGRFRQFETAQGSRVIVEHTFDRAGPHFHAGQPKLVPGRTGVNFGWDNSPGVGRRYKDYARYGKMDKPGGDHHFFYENGWGTWN
jgi:RHS repeat-associated protein